MKRNLATLLSLVVLGLAPAFSQQPAYPFNDPSLPTEKRIENLLSLMTVDEKVGCLGTRTGVPRLGVPNIGSSEGIHGVVQRERNQGGYERSAITTTQFRSRQGWASPGTPTWCGRPPASRAMRQDSSRRRRNTIVRC